MDYESLDEGINHEEARLKRAEGAERGEDVTAFELADGRRRVVLDYVDGGGHGKNDGGGQMQEVGGGDIRMCSVL